MGKRKCEERKRKKERDAWATHNSIVKTTNKRNNNTSPILFTNVITTTILYFLILKFVYGHQLLLSK